jgi:uncharacterized membrane protein
MIQATIVIIGVVLMLGALLTALKNMAEMVEPDSSFEDGFKAYLATMGVMVVGAFLFFSGIIWYVLIRIAAQ